MCWWHRVCAAALAALCAAAQSSRQDLVTTCNSCQQECCSVNADATLHLHLQITSAPQSPKGAEQPTWMVNRKRRGASASPACSNGTAFTKPRPTRVSAAGAIARKSKKSMACGWNRPTYSAVQMDALRPARRRHADTSHSGGLKDHRLWPLRAVYIKRQLFPSVTDTTTLPCGKG